MHCSLLFAVILIPLAIPSANGFTLELTRSDTPGNEGDTKQITVRLEGFIYGDVTAELKLLTLSQFQSLPIAPSGYTFTQDPAEVNDDFSSDTTLIHTFSSASSTRQTVEFDIDLVNDDLNEDEERFIVLVNVTNTVDSRDVYDPDASERLFATVTILVNANENDETKLRIAPNTGIITLSESNTAYALSLRIEAFPPEKNISISISTAQPVHQSPAIRGADYQLPITTFTLTRTQTEYLIPFEITDDDIAEPNEEGVNLIFSKTSGRPVTFVPLSTVTIIIEDNDSIEFGFSSNTLSIREGESAIVSVLIKSPDEIDVQLSGKVDNVVGSDSSTALATEIPGSFSFTLSQEKRKVDFNISIPPNNNIDPRGERQFTLRILDITGASSHLNIIPETIKVVIKDNDTDLAFGVKGPVVVPVIPRKVEEGETFTISIGFIENDIKLDADFVLGFSVIIKEKEGGSVQDAAKFFDTDLPITGVLNAVSKTQSISIKVADNDEVDPNKEFIIVVEHTTVALNPTARVGGVTFEVLIEDNDINIPLKPTANVSVIGNGNELQVSWNINKTDKTPIDGFQVKVIFPAMGENPGFTELVNISSDVSFTTLSYTQRGVDYSRANLTIVVCARNNKGESCSDEIYHLRPEQQGGGNPDDPEGVSPGAIAAIVIILLFLLLLLIFLILIFLLYRYFWKNYYPIIREKKNKEEFASFRQEMYDL